MFNAKYKTMLSFFCAVFGSLIGSLCTASSISIPPTSSWHWQLSGTLQYPNRHVYDIDLYDTPASTIANLKAQGRIVVCYFSAGSWEDWRGDAALYPQSALGNNLSGWPGERWLDIRNPQVRTLLAKRLDLAVSKGCHAVEPDNIDGYSNDNGLGLTAADQVNFNRWLADQAHARQLGIALKNAVELIPQLVNHFDFAINESCYRYNECGGYSAFTAQGKAVFIAEYRKYNTNMCNKAAKSGYQLQFFKRALTSVGQPCQ